jgi:hypothetical protein
MTVSPILAAGMPLTSHFRELATMVPVPQWGQLWETASPSLAWLFPLVSTFPLPPTIGPETEWGQQSSPWLQIPSWESPTLATRFISNPPIGILYYYVKSQFLLQAYIIIGNNHNPYQEEKKMTKKIEAFLMKFKKDEKKKQPVVRVINESSMERAEEKIIKEFPDAVFLERKKVYDKPISHDILERRQTFYIKYLTNAGTKVENPIRAKSEADAVSTIHDMEEIIGIFTMTAAEIRKKEGRDYYYRNYPGSKARMFI